jgi:hypothetical protein
MTEFQYLNGLNSEVQDKQAEAYLYASSGTTGIAATGVIEGLVVRQTSTASGSALIDAGACLNQASLGQGADRLINPSQKTLDIFTANPVGGLPRNDIVVFDSVTKLIAVIVGAPNATPTDPTVPATSVALARLRHAASATTIPTAKIDTLIVATSLRGAPSDRARGSVVNATLGSTGNCIVAHNLGVVPTIVITSVNGSATSAERTMRTATRGTSTFSVLCYYNGIIAPAGDTGWNFDWIAEA